MYLREHRSVRLCSFQQSLLPSLLPSLLLLPATIPFFFFQPIVPELNPSGDKNNPSVTLKPLDTLGLERKGTCGRCKCFFRVESAPHVGYLVTQGQQNGRNQTKVMEEMYKFANTILPEYNQDHLMLRPPQHMTISSDFAVQLNSKLVYASNSSIISKP